MNEQEMQERIDELERQIGIERFRWLLLLTAIRNYLRDGTSMEPTIDELMTKIAAEIKAKN